MFVLFHYFYIPWCWKQFPPAVGYGHLWCYFICWQTINITLKQALCLQITSTPQSESSRKQNIDIDESLCVTCLKEVPPNLSNGKGEKSLKIKGKDCDWVFCDFCERLLHFLSEEVLLGLERDMYMYNIEETISEKWSLLFNHCIFCCFHVHFVFIFCLLWSDK